ncbi:MAG TPA: uracil-DNA glycosylase, partial [Pirellulales bacterium]
MNDDPTRQSLLRGLAQAFEGLQRAGLTHTSRPALRDPSADDAPAAPVAYSAQESREEPPPVARSMPGETPSVGTFVDDRVSQQMPERQGVHDFDQGVARGAVDEPPPTVVSPAPTIRPAASPALFELDDAGRGGARPAASGQGSGREPDFAPVTRSDRETGLAILREEVRGCTQCALLSKLRKQTVFAAGNPNGKLVLVGEAPGADEDRLGEPFVGKAGKKLDEMLAAFGLDRTQVYIMNAIKCRPPENRVPAPDELANCRPFFLRQLDLLAPQ